MPRARGSLSVSNAGESRYEQSATAIAPSGHAQHNHHTHRILELVQDISYVARLKSKLVTLMTDEGPNGTVHLTPLFQQLDSKFRSRRDSVRGGPANASYALDLWAFKSLFSPLGLSDVEAEVLFALFLDDAARDAFQQEATLDDDASTMVSTQRQARGAVVTTVDGAEVMLAVRKLCHNVSTQFHEILKRVRSRRLAPTSLDRDGRPLCPFFIPYQQHNAIPKKREVFDFLSNGLGLTDSEAFLCLEYFMLAGEHDATSPDRGTSCESASPEDAPPQEQQQTKPSLDIGYVCAALFEHPLPDDVAFPLLMSKVVEAITNPNRGDQSGIPTVLEELLFFSETLHADGSQRNPRNAKVKPLPLEALKAFEEHCNDVVGPETPYSGVYIPCRSELEVRWMDLPLFRRFCVVLNLGIPSAEVELLFSYLAHPQSGGTMLQQSVLVEQIVLRYPKIPLPEVHRVAGMLRQQLLSRDVHGLNALHARLAVFENRPLPPLSFRAILRELGVSPLMLPSVLLDAIRRVAPRCVQVVSLIRGPLPPSRTETLEKLYVLLLEDSGRHPTSRGAQRRRSDVSPARISTRRDRFVHPSDKADAHAAEQLPWEPTRNELLQITVPTSSLLRRYAPELATGLITPAQVPIWRRHMEAYLDSLPDDDDAVSADATSHGNGASSSLTVSRRLLEHDLDGSQGGVRQQHLLSLNNGNTRTQYITFEELAYYWGNVSPAIDDDAQFTLMLWKSFSMHRGASHLPSGGSHTPNRDVASARQSVAPQQGERRMLRD